MRIAVIDGDSLLYFSLHPNKVLDDNNEPIKENGKFVYVEKTEDEIKASCDYLMQRLLLGGNFTHYVLLIKGKNTITSKLAINPEYKQNRKTEKPAQLEFTKQYFIDKWKGILVNDMETDDLVNITRLKLPNSHICAIDSDLLSLEGTHYNWNKQEWVTTSKEQAEYKFWCNMITGTHNNTKGIPGKGVKYFEKMLEEDDYGTKYHSLVLEEYVKYFGEYKGIQEFYKNYVCLYILEEKEGFEIPEVKEFKNDIAAESQSKKETTTRTDSY